MDLHEQRMTCLRMAIDMGCKPDAVIATATELLSFVTAGTPPVTVAEPQAAATDTIAACGTALPEAETADSRLAQPAGGSDSGVTETSQSAAPPTEGQVAEAAPATEPQTTPVEAAPPASEPVAATPAAPEAAEPAPAAADAPPMAADAPPAPAIPEPAEAAQVPAAEQAATAAEIAPASVANDLPELPANGSNGAALGDATSAATTAS